MLLPEVIAGSEGISTYDIVRLLNPTGATRFWETGQTDSLS